MVNNIKKFLFIFMALMTIIPEMGLKIIFADATNVKNGGYGWAAIDKEGHILGASEFGSGYKADYEKIGYVSDDMLAVCKGSKWGYINTSNKLVIPCKYDSASEFNNGIAFVKLNKKYGMIDKTGKLTAKFQYEDAELNIPKGINSVFGVTINDKWGFINNKGIQVVPFRFDSIKIFENGIIGVKENGKWGLMGKTGSLILKPQYDDVDCISCMDHENKNTINLLCIKQNGLYGFISSSGEVITPPEISSLGFNLNYSLFFSENLSHVLISEKVGFIDSTGKIVIKPQFEAYLGGFSCNFSEGLCPVMQNDKWGYINNLGEMVIPAVYSSAHEFVSGIGNVVGKGEIKYISGVRAVFFKGATNYIGKDGKVAFVQGNYNIINGFSKEGLTCVSIKDSGGLDYGYIDTKGQMVIAPEYSNAENFTNGIARVTDKKTGLNEIINAKGKAIFTEGDHKFILAIGKDSSSDTPVSVEDNGVYELINKEGKVLIKSKYYCMSPDITYGMRSIENNDLIGYMNEFGDVIYKPMFYSHANFYADNENGKEYANVEIAK